MLIFSEIPNFKASQMDQDQFQILFSTEDYIKLTKRNQQLQSQVETLKSQRNLIGSQLMTLKNQHNHFLKKYSAHKQQVRMLSLSGLAMAKKLIQVEVDQQKKAKEQKINNEQQQEQNRSQASRQCQQQTQWTVIDEQYYIKEIRKSKDSFEQENQKLRQQIMQLQMKITEKQIKMNALKQKNIYLQKYTNQLQQQQQSKFKQIEQMKYFIDQRISENKRMKIQNNCHIEQLNAKLKQQQQIIQSLKKQKTNNLGISSPRKSKNDGPMENIRQAAQIYFSQLAMKYLQMSQSKHEHDFNILLSDQCKVVKNYIEDICEAYKSQS